MTKKNFLYLIVFSSMVFVLYNFYRYTSIFSGWEYSDWLINYQGGFTRRGLIGEILFQIYDLTTFKLSILILVLVSSLYLVFYYFLFNSIKILKISWLNLLVFLSPLFFLYPITNSKVTGRKEIMLIAFFSFLAFFLKKNNFKKTKNIILIFFPLIVLSHSGLIFYVPYFLTLLFLINYEKKFTFHLKEFFPVAVISFILLFLVTFFQGSEYHVKEICNSVKNFAAKNCGIGDQIGTLKLNIEYPLNEKNGMWGGYLIIYLTSLIVAFFPISLIFFYSKFKSKHLKKINPLFIILIPFFSSIPLYYLAFDWGRYIYISYCCTFFLYIFCIKNNILKFDDKLIMFFEKKKIHVLFIIVVLVGYSFTWTVPYCCKTSFKLIFEKPIYNLIKNN